MGEIANDIINGFMCDQCGQFIDGEEPGYPRTCIECDPEKGHKLNDVWPDSEE